MSITGRRTGRDYELRVHDNGDPLSRVQRERVFQPFYRRPASASKAGRGVGLPVSMILARAMGGDLRIDTDSSGNTAILTLPASPSLHESPQAELESEIPPNQTSPQAT